MKKHLFICTALLALLSGCASLTKSQVEAVNQFAQTSKNFSAYPSKIMTSLADVYVKRGVYLANSLDDFDEIRDSSDPDDDTSAEKTVKQHITELNNILESKRHGYNTSRTIDITFQIIDKYIQALLLLSSDKHAANLGEQATNFGTGLNSLISTYNSIPETKKVKEGIGNFIGSLIMAGGKQWIRAKQANEIKRFVPEADEMIGVMTANLIKFLESGKIDSLITNEKKGIESDYKSFLRHRKPQVQNERDYLELYTDVDNIDTLRIQTIEATKNLRTAHAELVAEIKEKKNIKEIITALQTLYEDVKEVRATIIAIDSIKK